MKTIVAFLGLAALGLGLFYGFDDIARAGGPEAPPSDALFAVRRGDLEITVNEDGYLKAKNSIELKPKFRNSSVITWVEEEGKSVEEGDILVEFEKKDQQNSHDDLESKIVEMEVQLETARATLAIERREAQATIEKAALAHEIAGMQLERYEQGEAPNTKRKLTLEEEKSLNAWERAKDRFEEVPALQEEGFFTKAQVEEERLKVLEAKVAHDTAGRELQLYERYTMQMELKQKEADLKDKERELENAKEKGEISLKEKEAKVTRLDGQLRTSKARLDKMKEDLEYMTMRAPQAGVVHYGDPSSSWSRKRVKIGERHWQGSTVITLPDLSEMEALLKVHEADVDRLELEQNVRITLDTYPGQVFTGKVTHIAAVATSSGWDENTKAFRVTVTMDTPEESLRAGISADIEILVEHVEDVLHVPLHAVFIEEGESFCFVLEGSESRRRGVEIGRNSVHFVEITKGLEEDDRILLYDPRGETGGAGALAPGASDEGAEESGGALGLAGALEE